ncbi:AAA family ATPase [uncultured Winogradskyella sp.]|uniref:AAA family ATPase n=1 Tax=uncultured Winogradskyella sp. TaxID=395353 RepID=UPI003512048E
MSFKICYIWIREFRNFENFGFNLSSSEKFDFDVQKFRLSKKEISDVPNNFFGDNISDVAAFIGKNGTGKSNLLELVCKLVKGGKTSVDSDFLIITKDNNKYKCHYRFENYQPVESTFSIELLPYSGDIDNLKVIYFSNVYDERNHVFSSKVSDLSANNRYPRRIRRAMKRTASDFVKQFQFIRSESFLKSEIPMPKKVVLSPKLNTQVGSYWQRNYFSNISLNERFKIEYKKFFTELRALKPSKNKLYYFFIYVLISETLSEINQKVRDNMSFESEAEIYTNFLIEEIEKISLTYKSKLDIANKWKKWCDDILNLIFKHLENNSKNIRRVSDLNTLKNGSALLENFEGFIDAKEIKISTEGSRNRKIESYIFDFNDSKITLDKEYYNFIDWTNKFHLDWLGLSSGQKAYLDIFSLIRHDLRNLRVSNVLICIDEGDLYLHPKWQADFFYKLVNLVPKFRNAKYQLILTSHSPFLVSDLPKQNLVFLGRDSDNLTSDINKDDNVKTFAGNLGELYIDAFFMDGNLISRFAANEIQKVVDKINRKEKLTTDDKKVVELIGEDLIRIQINNLLNDSN